MVSNTNLKENGFLLGAHYIVSHRPDKGGRDLKPISTATMAEMPNDCSSKMIWMHIPTKPLLFSQNKLALFKIATQRHNTFHTNQICFINLSGWESKKQRETTYLGKVRITERKVGTTQLVQPDATIVPGVQLIVHDGNDLFISNLLFCKTPITPTIITTNTNNSRSTKGSLMCAFSNWKRHFFFVFVGTHLTIR